MTETNKAAHPGYRDLTALPMPTGNSYRSHWCGQLGEADTGSEVKIAGWVHRRRDHGGLIFVDLRDRTGIVQLVFNPDLDPEAHAAAHDLRSEWVVSVEGEVVARSEETVNPDLATGAIEIRVKEIEVLASAETPPFEIEGFSGEVGEETRLRYRYLDLRRERMAAGLALRHRIVKSMREFLDSEGFLEMETPVLTRSTPEGARDFLVPARVKQGSFYALPQSPQLFKQLLMVAGFERYYQIARCFRDEDLRADRQPDFTQLDIEMSFVGVDDVIDVNERLLKHVLGAAGLEVELPIPRMSYDEAIARFGSDRPDLRFGMELHDVSSELEGTEFKAFGGVLASGGRVIGMNAGKHELSRSELDGLVEMAISLGAKGLVWAVREGDGWRSPIAKFLKPEEIAAINGELEAGEGDVLLLAADEYRLASSVLGGMRTRLGERFGLIDTSRNELVWIVDWPLFEPGDEEGTWDALHHPFTAPDGELDPADPGKARALAYDIVWNGVEMGGGSIRINRPEVQEAALSVLGIDREEAEARFGFLLEALRYGAPPHGGIAYGVDRLAAMLHGTESIRDVIAFPKTASGSDPLTGAPATVDDQQLRELGVVVPKS